MDKKNTPIPVRRVLKKLGEDLRDARRRRRIPMQLAADRASISRSTLDKIEKGHEGVAIGAYIRIFFVLGLLQRIDELADIRFDKFGLELDAENLPKRIRLSKSKMEKLCGKV